MLEKETKSIFVIAVTYFLDSKLSDIPEAYRPKKGPLQAISVELILEDLANQLRAWMTETEPPRRPLGEVVNGVGLGAPVAPASLIVVVDSVGPIAIWE